VSGIDEQHAALQREVDDLRREQQEATERIAALEQRNQQLRELLGIAPARRPWRYLWLLLPLAPVFWITYECWPEQRQPIKTVSQPLYPHVLVTSDPPGADVSVGGHPAGRTPYLVPVRKRSAVFLVDVERLGYRPQRRELRVTPAGGVHWHAALQPGGSSTDQPRGSSTGGRTVYGGRAGGPGAGAPGR